MFAISQDISLRSVFAHTRYPQIKANRCRPLYKHRLACRATTEDPLERAKEAREKVEKQKAELAGQLENLKGLEVDGDFERQEIDKGKERAQQYVEELDGLKKELQKAVDKAKKSSEE